MIDMNKIIQRYQLAFNDMLKAKGVEIELEFMCITDEFQGEVRFVAKTPPFITVIQDSHKDELYYLESGGSMLDTRRFSLDVTFYPDGTCTENGRVSHEVLESVEELARIDANAFICSHFYWFDDYTNLNWVVNGYAIFFSDKAEYDKASLSLLNYLKQLSDNAMSNIKSIIKGETHV